MRAGRTKGVFLLMNFCCGSNKGARPVDLIQPPAVWVFLTLRVLVCLRSDVCLCVCVLGERYVSILQGDPRR